MKRDRITGNFFRSNQRRSVGVLATDAATEVAGADGFVGVTGSVITGNGYGVYNANADNSAPRQGAPMIATGNYWGPNAPAAGPSNPSTNVEGYSEPDTTPAATVTVTGRLTTPPALPTDYTPIANAAPTGWIVNPADGDEVPLEAETVPVVRASDDFAVASVSLAAGGESLGTVTKAPYEFSWTPGTEVAGDTVTLTATITDENGTVATTEIDVDVAEEEVVVPPDPPDPVDPTPPNPPVTPGPGTLKVGPVVRDKKRGTAVVTATVSGPGEVAIGGSGVKGQTLAVDSDNVVELKLKAIGKLKKALRRKGKAKAAFEVVFTPTTGDPVAKDYEITLVKKKNRKK